MEMDIRGKDYEEGHTHDRSISIGIHWIYHLRVYSAVTSIIILKFSNNVGV